MRLYFIDPGKAAITIFTKTADAARYVAKELGLIEVNWSIWSSFRLSHESKVLVL